jgi:predicted small integral membrane protein
MSYVKTYASILGWTFVAVAVTGFFLTGFGDFFGMDGETLILFGVNPAHNLIGARATEAGARAVVLVLSSAYLLVGVLGLILMDTSANLLAINQADNVLHLAIGALGIGVVAYATRRRAQPANA